MAGERILFIEPSAAVQEIGRAALEEAGFRVSIGANGVAALTAPDLADYQALVLDIGTEGIDGFMATRELKTDARTYRVPILLLIPEEEAELRGTQTLRGANGFLYKPFHPTALASRVRALIEEQSIRDQCDTFLREAANSFMTQLADQHIREAVENKTQIIVERAIQSVVTQLDQRIGREVNDRMTSLTADREQELVRATVHEVAQSMVEKLAERKVSEAIESVLAEQTEKVVRKVAEANVPTVARKQIKESLESILPREVSAQVQKAMETLIPDVSKKIVLTIDGIAQKVVPKAARERLPELTERHIKATTDKVLPEIVRELVGHELSRQMNDHLDPAIRDAATRLNRKTLFMWIVVFAFMGISLVVNILLILKMTGKF